MGSHRNTQASTELDAYRGQDSRQLCFDLPYTFDFEMDNLKASNINPSAAVNFKNKWANNARLGNRWGSLLFFWDLL